MTAETELLFVGDLAHSGTSGSQRLWAFKACGVSCAEVDTSTIRPKFGRLTGPMAKVLKSPTLLFSSPEIQKQILETCSRFSPKTLWLEWARYCTPEYLETIRRKFPSLRIVSFQDDNPFGRRKGDVWMWKDYLRSIPHFDNHFVKRPNDLVELARRGAGDTHLWMHGVYSPIFYPPTSPAKRFSVSFIGTCMDGRAKLIEALLLAGVDLHVFGTHWERRSDLLALFPKNFHDAVRGPDYGDVIRNSSICLGLVSHSNQDEWTMRSFEVPGCGTMLLGEDTPTHRELYVEGEEAVFFRSHEECARLAKTYSSDPVRSEQIAMAGRRKIEESGWFIENRVRAILPILGRLQ